MSTRNQEHISVAELWFSILASPIAWGLHFAGGWLNGEMGCAFGLGDTSILGLNGVLAVILILTLITLPIAIFSGFVAYQNWRQIMPPEGSENDLDVSDKWQRFMATLGMMNSLIFAIAIIVETVPVFVLPLCR